MPLLLRSASDIKAAKAAYFRFTSASAEFAAARTSLSPSSVNPSSVPIAAGVAARRSASTAVARRAAGLRPNKRPPGYANLMSGCTADASEREDQLAFDGLVFFLLHRGDERHRQRARFPAHAEGRLHAHLG